MCGSLATAGMVWAERVYVYTKKIMTNGIFECIDIYIEFLLLNLDANAIRENYHLMN